MSLRETLRQAAERLVVGHAAEDLDDGVLQADLLYAEASGLDRAQVMAASEEAGISLEMMVEVRNKFAEAYRTLINMQS